MLLERGLLESFSDAKARVLEKELLIHICIEMCSDNFFSPYHNISFRKKLEARRAV